MLTKPENFQEARKILVNAVNDDLLKKKLRNAKLRSVVILGAGIAAAIGLGIKTEDYSIGVLAVPFFIYYQLRRLLPLQAVR